jgi:hypothetical protein
MPALDNSYATLIYRNTAPGTAKASFTAEVAINDTAGMGAQFSLPAGYFKAPDIGHTLRIVGRGIVSSTATPTFTFTTRGGVAGSTASAILLGSAAITTGSGVANQLWEFQGDIILRTNLAAGANSTIEGLGLVSSPGGFASPFGYALFGGAAQPGTVATFDTSISNFLNFNVACSVSAAGNSIQLRQLEVWSLWP